MRPGAIGESIRIESRPGPKLVSGETVGLSVIKSLGGDNWAVGIQGRVYRAVSRLPLEPGMSLRARVSAEAGKVVLLLSSPPSTGLRAALQAQGISSGRLAEIVAQGLARSGLPIAARTVERAVTLLSRSRMEERKGARIIATLVDKGIDLAGPGVERLMSVLAFGERGGEDPRRYRGKRYPQDAPGVREFAAKLPVEAGREPSALQLYNHLRGASETWIVIPFLFGAGGGRTSGTLKILYDLFSERPLKLALTAGGLSFFLPLAGKRRVLSLYCDDPSLRRAAARGLDRLRAKFHNMGMEVDDTIHKGDAFDGFSPADVGVHLKGVDMVG